MKKCPNCHKTFEDNMKFCQTDGTPLVVVADNKPEVDPYATMVANKGDFELPLEEPKDEIKEEKLELDPFATMVAPSQASQKEESEILEVVGDDKKDDEIDPLKTMVVSGNTAGKVKLDIPDEIKDKPVEDVASEAQTIVAPDIPKFDEPNIAPPNLADAPPKTEDNTPAIDENKGVPSSPSEAEMPQAETPLESHPAPIPSPFDDSMPPRVSAPQSSPFESTNEPRKAEPLNMAKKETSPNSPFAEASEPFGSVESASNAENREIANNNQFESSMSSDSSEDEEQNQTLAIVSLVAGVLSMTICCFSGIFLGPIAIVTGFIARNNAVGNPNKYGGEKLALGGMITGFIGIIFFIILVILQFAGVFVSAL